MAITFRAGTPVGLPSLDPTRVLAWVIERADRAVGYLVLTSAEPIEQARHAYLAGLYVDPDERGRGIGVTALRFAADVGRTFDLRIYCAGVAGEDKRLPWSPA
jgi:L-amino acid N-acyltransferase YncA